MFRLRTVFYLQPTYAVIAFRLLDTALDVNILLLAERYMPLIENSLQIIAMDKMMPVEVVAVIQVDTQILDHGCIKILLLDRKSTRLNSSHVKISYAVFCLKKKII